MDNKAIFISLLKSAIAKAKYRNSLFDKYRFAYFNPTGTGLDCNKDIPDEIFNLKILITNHIEAETIFITEFEAFSEASSPSKTEFRKVKLLPDGDGTSELKDQINSYRYKK